MLKRCNELSLWGSLRGSIEKECNMLKDEQQVKKKENVYVAIGGFLMPFSSLLS